jgi:SAM-dependent methyltransferase
MTLDDVLPDTWGGTSSNADRRPNVAMPGGSGDRWPDDYERGRPGYPGEAVDVTEVPASSSVLDLGAGTGKLTRLLLTKFARVVAVEPADAMRRRLAELCPGAEALAGSAEAIPLDDASVDAVFSAEAFHWFDGERGLAEIARVLRPRGALVLMWNVPGGAVEPPIEALERLVEERAPRDLPYDPCDLNADRFASGDWRAAFAGSPFEELREVSFANAQTLDRDAFVALLASMGWVAELPDDERLPLLDTMRSLLDADEYVRPWTTLVYWTRMG